MRGISLWYPSFFVPSLSPLSLQHNLPYLSPLSPLPLILLPPIYICSIFHTILCKYSAHISQVISHLSPLSIYLSCVIYLSYLSPYLLSNIYYIYNKYLIYLSLPYILYTHDHICSIFIIDYVIIQVISNDSYHIYLSLISSSYPLVWMDMYMDGYICTGMDMCTD